MSAMRIVLPLVLIALVLGLLGFLLANMDTRVAVTLGGTEYPEVRLFTVVFIAVALGALVTCVVALVEGAALRLANRRLRREILRLETEINYLRTQPPIAQRSEPDAIEPVSPVPARSSAAAERTFPSAPVYSPDDTAFDPDEDVYTGGRAV